MPTYTLKDIKNNKEWDIRCSYGDLQKMLDENQDIVQVMTAPAIVSGSMSTLRRAGGQWQNLLGKIKKGSGKDNTIHD